MGTGFRATFVISWSQTDVDGQQAAPLDMLTVGAAWRWTGEAVCVDAPGGVLRLEAAEGAADMHRRAARTVRRLVGMAVAGPQGARGGRALDAGSLDAGSLDIDAEGEQGFVVTDGQRSFVVTLIAVPGRALPLLMFVGDLPPAGCELWVVRCHLEPQGAPAGARSAGGVICFTPGTRIATQAGSARIEHLRAGDAVQTKDNGLQQILWTGHRRMTGARLYAMPHLRPVRFRPGALGIGRPDEDLLVSPQHRMLLRGPAAQALFNVDEVLVAAEDLVNDGSVSVDFSAREVTYIHILLERHNILWANGIETESFHPSNTALDTIEPAQRAALMALLPGLEAAPHTYGDYARRNLSASEAAILRHELAA